jgi:hypothetical protein
MARTGFIQVNGIARHRALRRQASQANRTQTLRSAAVQCTGTKRFAPD